MVLVPDRWSKQGWKYVDLNKPDLLKQREINQNRKNEGNQYGLEWRDMSYTPDPTKIKDDYTTTQMTTNKNQMVEMPIDNSWQDVKELVQRVSPEGEIDEWNEDIQKLMGNKRFSKRLQIEAMTKNKKRMLKDNDQEYNDIKVNVKSKGDVFWGGDMKGDLDFNKKRNFYTDYQSAVNNNGI